MKRITSFALLGLLLLMTACGGDDPSEPSGQSPTAAITSPNDGSTFTEVETISFTGTATDPEDGALTGQSLIWTSDKDGRIGTGTSFTTSNLSVNQHTVTLTVTDNDGDVASDAIVIMVTGNSGPTMIDMVLLNGGTFQVGSTSQWAQPNEQPMHSVTLSPFSIAKYEVTNEEMREVMQWAYDNGRVNASNTTVTNAEGSAQELLDLDGYDCEISFSNDVFTIDNGKDNRPCIWVTWYGAQAFCNYVSDMEGVERCIDFTDWSSDSGNGGYRLPTEAEWEYACRAGTTTDYYNGDGTQRYCDYDPNLDAIGWYCGNHTGKTEEVGLKTPNDWGLFDMSGNVLEWCGDWNGSYSSETQTDPTGPVGGSSRVRRGGGWNNLAEDCRSAMRGYASPGYADGTQGLRPVRR